MSSQHRSIRCIRGAAMALAMAGSAATAHAGSTNSSVAVTSDYLFRGVSQTDRKPALQGGVTWTEGPYATDVYHANYDVAPDGRSFVMIRPVEENRHVVMVVNWIEELRRRTRVTP